MSKIPAIAGVLSTLILILACALFVIKPKFDDIVRSEGDISELVRHPVTEEMNKDADNRADKVAPDFTLPDTEGKMVSLSQLLKSAPVVLVMTKDGCPCSIEVQPHMNKIAKAFGDSIQFVGVMDADQKIAEDFFADFQMVYPLLSSPDAKFFEKYNAEQSVYTFFIRQDGTIRKVWPGYSKSSLQELISMITDETGKTVEPMVFDHAPTEMTSGCYFFKPNTWELSEDQ